MLIVHSRVSLFLVYVILFVWYYWLGFYWVSNWLVVFFTAFSIFFEFDGVEVAFHVHEIEW